jgi:heme exporter protein C
MKGIWWKSLSVLILVYVIIAGIAVPLKPGISAVQPTRAEAGSPLTLLITGYNTEFTRVSDSMQVWLKLDDDNALLVSSRKVLNDRELSALFNIPDTFPLSGEIHPLTLVVSDRIHGSFVLPNAVFVRGCTFGKANSGTWQDARTMRIDALKTFRFPYRNILHETIRNVYYHVPMWFGMIIIFFGSAWCSIQYIRHGRPEDDLKSQALNATATLFGILGLLTGMLWAYYTWGSPWSWDVKQNTAAIAVLIYMAYFVLRSSLPDPDRRARVAAVYNIFGCAMLIPLLFVIPRMTASLHPGSGGNPALGEDDLDNMMRLVFYPAVIGWTLLGIWISELRYRILKLEWKRVFGN